MAHFIECIYKLALNLHINFHISVDRNKSSGTDHGIDNNHDDTAVYEALSDLGKLMKTTIF